MLVSNSSNKGFLLERISSSFHATGLFLHSLKTSENIPLLYPGFSEVLRGIEMGGFLMFSGGIERDQ